jgi:DNA-binding IclR family transcriptional regulator
VRAAQVLEFLAVNPNRAFTLSELRDALGINIASLSAVLTTLHDTGYLVRDSRHKTYQLGPMLIPVGHAASAAHPVVTLAVPHMKKLASRVNAECVGTAIVGDEFLILAMEGRPSGRTRGVSLGQRVPMLPPFGQVFLAWSSGEAIDNWLDRQLGGGESRKARAHIEASLRSVRERGYAVSLRSRTLDGISDLMAELAEHPASDELRFRLAELIGDLGDDYELLDESPDARHEVAQIIAPVFGPDGSVVFALSLIGLDRLHAQQILDFAHDVRAASTALTREIGGAVPR